MTEETPCTDTRATSQTGPTTIVRSELAANNLFNAAVMIANVIENLEDGTATEMEAAGVWDLWGVLKKLIADANPEIEAALLAWMEVNGDLPISDELRLYPGYNKTTKSKNNAATLTAVIDAVDGDFDAAVACLSSQPFKHGTVRERLNDDALYERLFERVVTSKVKEGSAKGQPRKKIQVADETRS